MSNDPPQAWHGWTLGRAGAATRRTGELRTMASAAAPCTCRWTFRLGRPIRFPDPQCPVHAASPHRSYVVVQPYTLGGEGYCFSTTVEADSIEAAQTLGGFGESRQASRGAELSKLIVCRYPRPPAVLPQGTKALTPNGRFVVGV